MVVGALLVALLVDCRLADVRSAPLPLVEVLVVLEVLGMVYLVYWETQIVSSVNSKCE